MPAEIPCNLCGSLESTVLFESSGKPDLSAFAATTDRFGAYGRVVRCRKCDLVFTSPRLEAGELVAAYAASSDDTYVTEADARSMNAYLSLAAIRRHASKGRLLEVGCSTGYFLNAARLTFDVVGIEPSSWARKIAVEQLKLDVPAATLGDARFPGASFDAAALIDVIEHVADPAALLSEIARVLKPGGILYVVTPDIGSLSAKILGPKWWGLRPAHVYYYSRRTLKDALAKAGFDVVEIRSYGRIFTWGYWLTRLADYPGFVTGAVRGLIAAFGIEDKFLYIDTRDSMQVIARRRS
jgi:2-polyprenyl-3-methyl-5-hydroxy-6-metoxy-1,4-benzoquinol methylase